jgi:predicted Fe-Mo cluster-binding NifX family protein
MCGKCRKFWKYELKDGEVTDKQLIEVEKEQSFSQSGEVLEKLLLPMDIFVTTGMGDRLREKLRNIGVHVMVTAEIEPEQFICSLISTK